MIQRRKREEAIFKACMYVASGIILALLLFILYTIVRKGLPYLTLDMITKLPGGGFYLGKEGGILNAILGSIVLVSGAVVLSLLVALPVVVYLNFYLSRKSRFGQTVRFSFDILFGIPSIVYGAFGFTVMILLGIKASLLGGILTVAVLILPVMVRSIDEMAVQIPRELVEAPKALGATRFETVQVLLRQLLPSIVTATLLALGRGMGDAATVLFTAGYTDNLPTALGQPAATLPLAIFFQLSSPVEEVQGRAYAAALILTILILTMSFLTRYFGRRLSRHNI